MKMLYLCISFFDNLSFFFLVSLTIFVHTNTCTFFSIVHWKNTVVTFAFKYTISAKNDPFIILITFLSLADSNSWCSTLPVGVLSQCVISVFFSSRKEAGVVGWVTVRRRAASPVSCPAAGRGSLAAWQQPVWGRESLSPQGSLLLRKLDIKCFNSPVSSEVSSRIPTQ